MKRIAETNGWVELSWEGELDELKALIKDTLATYNSSSPITLDIIIRDVEELISKVNIAWKNELANKSLDSARTMHKTFLESVSATIKGIQER